MAILVTKPKRPIKKNYNFFGGFTYMLPSVAEMFILFALLLLGALLGNVISAVFALIMDAKAALEYGMLVSYPIMFIPAMMYAKIKSGRNSFNKNGVKLDSKHFKPLGGALTAVTAAVCTLALGFCVDAISAIMPKMPERLEEVLKSMTTGTLWINLLMVGVFAPFFEEWLCRGMILRGLLNNRVKPAWAIAISAVFFAVIHLNPWQAIPALMLGGLFGYVYYKTGSLKVTMLMHCVNNVFAVICSNIPAIKDMDNWQDVLPAPTYWLIFTGCLILVVLCLMSFKKIPLEKPAGNSDEVHSLFSE